MKKAIALCAALGSLVLASPAAASVTFDFTGGSSALDGANGNTVMKGGALNVTASAWWYNASYASGAPQSAYLGQYAQGLGVTDHAAAVNPETGGSNTHTIDNQGNYDFIVLIFNQAVNIQSVVLSPFSINGSTDNDAWIGRTNAPSFNSSVFATLLGSSYDISGSGSASSLALGPSAGQYGNIWLIGAAGPGSGSTDSYTDGFKLSSIVVNQAVPEPSTWAMMLLGFGAIGFAMRRNRKGQPALSQLA